MRKFELSKNELKLLAAAAMLLDHIGAELLPEITVLRIIGRLAFPVFAFSIYEGCRYTHNRKRYLLQMLGLGLACTAGYYLYAGVIFGNILITFSLSICVLYSLRPLQDALRQQKISLCPAEVLFFAAVLIGAGLVCLFMEVD